MTIASDLLQQHIRTLVDDNARWQTLIADDILWELAYAPSLGHVGIRDREICIPNIETILTLAARSTFFKMPKTE
jgi:hypothetical protein